jgi:beta-glucanase (GH16 family)
MTFHDEFDQFRPWNGKTGLWRTTFGDGKLTGVEQRTLQANGELEVYVDADMADAAGKIGVDPFKVKDGVLEITAARTTPPVAARLKNYGYTSGLITTQPSFSQRYGYFEMRARLPQGKGLWPAFWLLPADLSWPPEIDVMESVGDPTRAYVTAHSKTAKAEGIEVRLTPGEFHVFAVSWGPEMLVWYVDGREVGRQPTPPDLNKPMYMLANLALGGGWAGAPDGTTPFPATYAIDYIRAYRFAP